MRVVTGRPEELARAVAITREAIAEVDAACSRFRDDSELSRLGPLLEGGAEVSPLLAELVGAALWAAEWTDGAVDPTLGAALVGLGYDRDLAELDRTGAGGDAPAPAVRVTARGHRSAWRDVVLEDVAHRGTVLHVPRGVLLDLGATAKAVAADRAAARAAEDCGGVLVSLGGDLATAGAEPGGWEILVRDLDADPAQQVHLAAGAALATSSTQKRRWRAGGVVRHHILDPRTLLPAAPSWRTATVSARSCLEANALSTAAIVLGPSAPAWLRSKGAQARLVDAAGRVVVLGGWPEPAAPEHPASEPAASSPAAGAREAVAS